MEKKISVIVPVYNAVNKLERCVESILNSSYQNIEIILVDDGSIDGSGELCDKLGERNDKIRIFHKENGGQASARNYGLDFATGDYITFVDDDDTINREMYAILLSNIEEYHVMISGCATLMIFENGYSESGYKDSESGYWDSKYLINNILYQKPKRWGTVWNKIFKKELWENIRFPEGCEWEDYLVIIKLFYIAKKVYFDSRPLYSWYQTSDSQSKRPFHEGLLTANIVCNEIENYLLKNDDTYEKACIHFRFCLYYMVLSKVYKTRERRRRSIFCEYYNAEKNIMLNYLFDKNNSKADILKLFKLIYMRVTYKRIMVLE